MSALRLLTTRQERAQREHLAQSAARLWPDAPELQLAWMRAVAVVRATKRGWLLERPVRRVEE